MYDFSLMLLELSNFGLIDNFINDKQWLKHNFEPWDLVCIKWKETSKRRMCFFKKSSSNNIGEFLTEWSLYKNYLGYQLVCTLFF